MLFLLGVASGRAKIDWFTANVKISRSLSQKNCYRTFGVVDVLRGGVLHNINDVDNSQDNVVDEQEKEEALDKSSVTDKSTSPSTASTASLVSALLGMLFSTFHRTQSMLAAAFVTENEADLSLTQCVLNKFGRMYQAAISPPMNELECHEESQYANTPVDDGQVLTDIPATLAHDFGLHISTHYGVNASRYDNGMPPATPIHGGTLKDALESARQEARCLLVLIPASKPHRNVVDTSALTSFLSAEVAILTEERPLPQSKKNNVNTGSFLLWSAKATSSEASLALKRFAKLGGVQIHKHRPLLLVVYPATVLDKMTGTVQTVPKVLAQHHCSPPPTATKMVDWLIAIRERHSREYMKLRKVRQESIWTKERTADYQDSAMRDAENRLRHEQAKRDHMAAEKVREERLNAILTRREELRSTIPDEPDASTPEVKTVALRFANGQTGQRRFAPSTKLTDLFNWVDAMFDLERETVVLVSMNGKQSFEWINKSDDIPTLEEAGFGKMVGLRVTIKKKETDDKVDIISD